MLPLGTLSVLLIFKLAASCDIPSHISLTGGLIFQLNFSTSFCTCLSTMDSHRCVWMEHACRVCNPSSCDITVVAVEWVFFFVSGKKWTYSSPELSHRVPSCTVICLYFSAPMVTRTWLNLLVSSCALPPGLLLMVGLMLYPAGWGSEKVIGYCGAEALPFRPAQCSLGWAFYAAIGGTLASFLCAVLSAQAEIATSSDKVQEEIEEGKSLICLLWAFRNLGETPGNIWTPVHNLHKISWLLKS